LPLAADAMLELSKDAKKLPQHGAHWGGRVHALLVAEQLDLAVIQLAQDHHQVPHGSSQPVCTPDNDLLELALLGFDQQLLQFGAISC
jgi:hypothetical protein